MILNYTDLINSMSFDDLVDYCSSIKDNDPQLVMAEARLIEIVTDYKEHCKSFEDFRELKKILTSKPIYLRLRKDDMHQIMSLVDIGLVYDEISNGTSTGPVDLGGVEINHFCNVTIRTVKFQYIELRSLLEQYHEQNLINKEQTDGLIKEIQEKHNLLKQAIEILAEHQQNEFTAVRSEFTAVRSEFTAVRSEFTAVRSEITALGSEFQTRYNELEKKMDKGFNELKEEIKKSNKNDTDFAKMNDNIQLITTHMMTTFAIPK